MAAFTSKASGNWSSGGQTTWNEAGVPGAGDTATVSHTVTVDTATILGTSPNDTTTNVLTIGAAGRLVVASSLTLRGNAVDSFGSIITLNAGGSIVFDASASGGTPVYQWAATISTWAINGTSGSHCAISAVSGHTFRLTGTIFPTLACSYCDFTRHAAATWTLHSSGTSYSITNSTFTSCGQIVLSAGGTAGDFIFNDNTFASGTGTNNLNLAVTGTHTSGTREFIGNSFDKIFTDASSVGFTYRHNVFAGGKTALLTSGSVTTYEENFLWSLDIDGHRIGRVASILNNYITHGGPNPHFLVAAAHNQNLTVQGNIFEHTADYATDNGDCLFPVCASPFKVIVKNNIVLPSSFSGATHTSGCLATHYDSTFFGAFSDSARVVEYTHNTVYCQSPNDASQGAVDVAEGQNGVAGEILLFKSNLLWSATANHGLKISRLQGTVNGLITSAGADYNASYNLLDGDNGRGYNDNAGNLDLFDGTAASGNDADDNGVDDNGITADPLFVDSSRNHVTWAIANGYGNTAAQAITAIKVAPRTRIPDLIDWVKEGLKPQALVYRNAGHDGVTIGAVDWGGAIPTLVYSLADAKEIDVEVYQ